MVIEFHLTVTNYLKHNEIITLPEDKVELLFKQTAYSVGELVLSVKKGDKSKQYKVRTEPVDISEFFTEAGEVTACLTLAVRGEVARTWQIEPFCAREVPDGIEVVPEVEALKDTVDKLTHAIVELNNIINEKEI